MKVFSDDFSNKIIFGKYKIFKRIGIGIYSNVFSGIIINNLEQIAFKIQEKRELFGQLEKEAFFLLHLKGVGIPKIISYGFSGNYRVLIEELLGKTLEQLFQENKNKSKIIRLKDMLMAAIQIIDRFEFIHSKDIIHLDIKPNNFLVGNPDSSIIYVIDFGFAKKYRSSRTGKHISFSKRKTFAGNLKYSSINTMKGIEPSRRDDLESLGYMLIYLYNQELPWDKIKSKTKEELTRSIYDMKKKFSIKAINQDIPEGMEDYMNYVKSLKFEEDPDYNYLKIILENMLQKINEVNDLNFSWINESFRNKLNTTYSKLFTKRKVSLFSKLLKNFNSKTGSKSDNEDYILNNNFRFSYKKEDNFRYSYKKEDSNFMNHKFPLTDKSIKEKSSKFKIENKNNDFNKKIITKSNFINQKYKPSNRVNNENISKKIHFQKIGKIIDKSKTIFDKSNNGINNEIKFKFIISPIINNKTINVYQNSKIIRNTTNNSDLKKVSINKNKKIYNLNNNIKEINKLGYSSKLNSKKCIPFYNYNNNVLDNKKIIDFNKTTSLLSTDIFYNRKFGNNNK